MRNVRVAPVPGGSTGTSKKVMALSWPRLAGVPMRPWKILGRPHPYVFADGLPLAPSQAAEPNPLGVPSELEAGVPELTMLQTPGPGVPLSGAPGVPTIEDRPVGIKRGTRLIDDQQRLGELIFAGDHAGDVGVERHREIEFEGKLGPRGLACRLCISKPNHSPVPLARPHEQWEVRRCWRCIGTRRHSPKSPARRKAGGRRSGGATFAFFLAYEEMIVA